MHIQILKVSLLILTVCFITNIGKLGGIKMDFKTEFKPLTVQPQEIEE